MTGHRSLVRVVKARHKMVVLDFDLAGLHETTVDAINKAVMRNVCHFPPSECFRLSNDEWLPLKRSIDVDGVDRGNWLCAPLVFTDDGALIVSNILDTFDATRGSGAVWRVVRDLQVKAMGAELN